MYDQFYGFQGRPFQLTPDPHFYFESATHRKALSYLGYGLAQEEGFIVITGEIGAGKTTLVAHVMATIDPQSLTAARIVSTQVMGDDMLRLVAQGFGVTEDRLSKAQLLQRIEAFLHTQARKGLRSLLIVDEAQNLPASSVEELRMLSNFQLGGHALLQIILVGQPEFREILDAPEMEQLRQRVIATHHLEAMQANEIGPYVQHRLSLVGWRGDPRFTAGAFSAVYEGTAGVPRRVNALMSRVLLLGAVDRLHEIDAQVVQAVAADMGMTFLADQSDALMPLRTKNNPVTEAVREENSSIRDGEGGGTIVSSVEKVAVDEDAVSDEAGEEKLANDDALELHAIRDELDELRRSITLATGLNSDQQALVDRVAELEKKVTILEAREDEQEAALRRVLTLLIDWVETEEAEARLG